MGIQIFLLSLFWASLLGLVVSLFGLVAFLGALSLFSKTTDETSVPTSDNDTPPLPKASLIIPLHGEALAMERKLESVRRAGVDMHDLEIILTLDGPVPGLEERLLPFDDLNAQVVSNARLGKNYALSSALARTTGDVIVVSDLEAVFDEGALAHMLAPFADPHVGGVCGRLLMLSAKSDQSRYWSVESWIKSVESKLLGSITASNGSLLAFRRRVLDAVPDGVADDLFIALSCVRAGYRYVFQPAAVVRCPSRSRTVAQTFTRQRRVVLQGLSALTAVREVLVPARYGQYAVALILHKVVRRMAPFFAGMMLLSGMALTPWLTGYCWTVLAAVAGLLCVAVALPVHPQLARLEKLPLVRPAAWALAMAGGVLAGQLDFLRGKSVTVWNR